MLILILIALWGIALFIRDVAEGIWNIAADFKEKHKAEGGDEE